VIVVALLPPLKDRGSVACRLDRIATSEAMQSDWSPLMCNNTAQTGGVVLVSVRLGRLGCWDPLPGREDGRRDGEVSR